jgi:hypothetical protein
MGILKYIIRKLTPAPKNIRVKNLVYDMAECRQSPRAIELDLMHRKERATR